MKRVLLSVLLTTACAGTTPQPGSSAAPGDVYEVVNLSACTARIVLHDLDGQVVTHMKFEDLPAGRTARYRLPSRVITLTAVPVDAMRNACGMAESQKIQVTKVQ
jgi:hypothetical protein